MLWPKVENPDSGYRLAVTGAIRDTAIDHADIAWFAADYLLKKYPDRLKERNDIMHLPETEEDYLTLLAKQRGCVTSGGRVDFDRVSKVLLQEIRSGKFGGLTFETPAMAKREEQQVLRVREQKAAKEKARKERFKKRSKK